MSHRVCLSCSYRNTHRFLQWITINVRTVPALSWLCCLPVWRPLTITCELIMKPLWHICLQIRTKFVHYGSRYLSVIFWLLMYLTTILYFISITDHILGKVIFTSPSVFLVKETSKLLKLPLMNLTGMKYMEPLKQTMLFIGFMILWGHFSINISLKSGSKENIIIENHGLPNHWGCQSRLRINYIIVTKGLIVSRMK